jgi:hypothetical protein
MVHATCSWDWRDGGRVLDAKPSYLNPSPRHGFFCVSCLVSRETCPTMWGWTKAVRDEAFAVDFETPHASYGYQSSQHYVKRDFILWWGCRPTQARPSTHASVWGHRVLTT